MPPKRKISKSMILSAVLSITRSRGYAAVNARSIAKALDCSTQPIYSVFSTMTHVRSAFRAHLESSFTDYVRNTLQEDGQLWEIGRAYCLFAREEPMLFTVLASTGTTMTAVYAKLFTQREFSLSLNRSNRILELPHPAVQRILRNLWIFSHGIASLLTVKHSAFSEEEITQLMKNSYEAFLAQEYTLAKSSGE